MLPSDRAYTVGVALARHGTVCIREMAVCQAMGREVAVCQATGREMAVCQAKVRGPTVFGQVQMGLGQKPLGRGHCS
jgi:hypothetical protein